jgi:tetratricopeptide (TPR) repeat protein
MEGRRRDSIRAARELAAASSPEMARQMADGEPPLVAPLVVLARFGQWKTILREPAPPDDLPYARAIWHYARGLAFARTGRLQDAATEQAALDAAVNAIPADRKFVQVVPARGIATLAGLVLTGELAAARGRTDEAIRHLEEAVRVQDELPYMEPPPWYYPVRQSLGAVLSNAGRAKAAEAVYREDLRRNPENGWSLHGLARSLRAQGKATEAAAVERRFRKAWTRADVRLVSSRF